jgi:hypothetical protein
MVFPWEHYGKEQGFCQYFCMAIYMALISIMLWIGSETEANLVADGIRGCILGPSSPGAGMVGDPVERRSANVLSATLLRNNRPLRSHLLKSWTE